MAYDIPCNRQEAPTRSGPQRNAVLHKMTKFLLTTAGVAAVLTLLSGGRRYVPLPRPQPPRAHFQGPRSLIPDLSRTFSGRP